MRKVLVALITAGCFATALSASRANAQVDAWNGGWHVGGDFYYPTDYSYSSGPVYGYGSAPIDNYASAPIYNYAPAPLYDYGAAPAYGAAVVAAPVPAPNYAYNSAVGAPVRTVEIVRTVYLPTRSAAHREIAMRQTARPAMAESSSRPLRDSAGSASVASNAQPLYDTAAIAPANAGPHYRYVYQRDRILVIDPSNGSVVQTLRR